MTAHLQTKNRKLKKRSTEQRLIKIAKQNRAFWTSMETNRKQKRKKTEIKDTIHIN